MVLNTGSPIELIVYPKINYTFFPRDNLSFILVAIAPNYEESCHQPIEEAALSEAGEEGKLGAP